jgi:uncharacterized LabA/DUF88 family protein
MDYLRAVVVMDYQNVHLTGHDLFAASRGLPRHASLIDPLLFANELLRTRNLAQKAGFDHAVLSRVLVYRGLPSADHDRMQYARSLAQRAHWERDDRVHVVHRALKYEYERDEEGNILVGPDGRRVTKGRPREKGVDVLCALALVREAADGEVDLVILASRDSDLRPALDEALRLGSAKIETTTWHDPEHPGWCRPLRPDDEKRRLWNTKLGETQFQRCLDRIDYT